MANVMTLQEREERDEQFVREFVNNAGNATQAARSCEVSEASASNTGYRMKERLWEEIEYEIYLEAIHTKSAKPRALPLNQEARQALIGRMKFRAEYCPDAPYVFVNRKGQKISSIKKSFRTACTRAGISDFRIHDLRHTFASWLVRRGVTLVIESMVAMGGFEPPTPAL